MKVMEELRAEHQQQLDRERKAYLELKQASSSQRQAQIRIPALNLHLSGLWERCLRERHAASAVLQDLDQAQQRWTEHQRAMEDEADDEIHELTNRCG